MAGGRGQLSVEYFMLVAVLIGIVTVFAQYFLLINSGAVLGAEQGAVSAEALSYISYYDSLSLGPYVAGDASAPVVCDANGCRYKGRASAVVKPYRPKELLWYR